MTDIAIQRPTAVAVRRSVPWMTVLTFGTVIAFADGFWILSLRGAVGSIAHTQGPFVSWVRESLLSLPLFVLAVLVAVTLGHRWFGAKATTPKAVMSTGLLMVATTSLVAVVLLLANSAYDYVLQVAELTRMDNIHPMCTTEGCLSIQQQASLVLQYRSMAYGTGLILLTNLVVIGWIIAMRGGRLDLAKVRVLPEGVTAVSGSRAQDMQRLLAAGLAGTAIIHASLIPAVWNVRLADGLLYSLLAVSGAALAVLLVVRPRRWQVVAAVVVTLVPLALWLASSLISPGPRQAATVNLADIPAAALELITVIVAAALLINGKRVRRPGRSSEHARWIAVVAVIAITVLGLAVSGLPGLDDYAAMGQLGPAIAHHHN